jgi:tripartite-type tricarboxylate transporter receptor subunit TctC
MRAARFSSGLALLAILSGPLSAAETPYYEGKTLKIIVSSSPGGGTDSAARLIARFLPKYLPGNPKTAVQNMPGGGGTIANNYFAAEVKPDGLTLLQDSSSGIGNFVRGGPTIKYDPRKFRVIGGISRAGSLLLIRNDARPRLTDRSAKPVVVGDTDGIRSWMAMTVWGAEYLGWNLRWIYGYPGTRELALAIRQAEIDMWSTQNAKLVRDLQREGVVQILATDGNARRKDFPETPTFVELLGPKRPSGLAWQAYLAWSGAPELDKFLVAPEGTPDHLVNLLREAFMKAMKDPELDQEGDKFFGEGWKAHPGEVIEAVIREHTAIAKEATDFLARIRQKYGLPIGQRRK